MFIYIIYLYELYQTKKIYTMVLKKFIFLCRFLLTFFQNKAFGKDGGYAVGIFFLPMIFYMILAFGKSEYIADNSNNVEVEKVSE